MTRLAMLLIGSALLGALAVTPADAAGNVLYLNRCVGDCVVTQGPDDARANTSTIPATPGAHTLTEFAWGDAQWDALVTCVREVYSPYDIEVTDIEPSTNVMYNEQMVAGVGGQIGRADAGGISPGVLCNMAVNNVITFTFANGYGGSGKQQVDALCYVVAQESGHSYGLDHAYVFTDNMSACTDPMSYRGDCGGQRFFRNLGAKCGEYAERSCRCQDPQNSHLTLLAQLGPGTPITRAPEVRIAVPATGSTIAAGGRVVAVASAQRGVAFVDLQLNGYTWATLPGVAFGDLGQPEAQYALILPADVPDGVIDVEVIARDDLGVATTSETVRVTKGAPCTSADTCAEGQTCDGEGRCLWAPPTGVLGDACDYPQFCMAGLTCEGVTDEEAVCTQACVLGISDSCPAPLTCATSTLGGARCLPGVAGDDAAGCCSTGRDAAAQSSLLAIALGVLVRRRRRKPRC